MALTQIDLPDAEIYYDPSFLAREEATDLFNVLRTKCTWERRAGSFGHKVPRDESYYGDAGTDYSYSRREYRPRPWILELLSLKNRIEQVTPATAYTNSGLPTIGYNAVLCNLYLGGNDSVGLHADDEVGMAPIIGSLSLMSDPHASRLFRLRRNEGTIAWSQRLTHGSLLIMAGDTQKNYEHEIPKERGLSSSRINLTFRHISHQ